MSRGDQYGAHRRQVAPKDHTSRPVLAVLEISQRQKFIFIQASEVTVDNNWELIYVITVFT